MTCRKSFAASAGISTPIAAIVIVIIVCGSAFGIVALQLFATGSGKVVSSTHLTESGVAQVAVTAVSLRSSDFLSSNAGTTFTCGAASGSFITVSNTGNAGTDISSVTISSRTGVTDSYSLAAGSTCLVGAAGSGSATQNLLFASTTKLHTSATAGGSFSGTVGGGILIIFTGTFQ